MELIKASLMAAAGGGKSANLQAITINQNNSRHIAGQSPYEGIDGWNDIRVEIDVPPQPSLSTLYADKNKVYHASDYGVYGWHTVNVDVGFETEKPLKEVTEFVGVDPIVEDTAQSEYHFRVDKHLKEGDPTREIITPAFWYKDTGEMVSGASFQPIDAPIGLYVFVSFTVTDKTTGAWETIYRVNGNLVTFTGTNPYCKNFGGIGATYRIKNTE